MLAPFQRYFGQRWSFSVSATCASIPEGCAEEGVVGLWSWCPEQNDNDRPIFFSHMKFHYVAQSGLELTV